MQRLSRSFGLLALLASPLAATSQAVDWEFLGPTDGEALCVEISPSDASTALAGIAGQPFSLLKTVDGGANWEGLTWGLTQSPVYDVEIAPDGTYYIATADRIWESADAGASWTQLQLGIGAQDVTLELELDPSDPLVMWTGLSQQDGLQPVTVMRSGDGGANWDDVTPPTFATATCAAIAIDPTNTDTVYAAMLEEDPVFTSSIWKTVDGGLTWSDVTPVLPLALTFPFSETMDLAHDGTNLYLCGSTSSLAFDVGLWVTADDGASWTELSGGSWPTRDLVGIEIDPSDANTLWIASSAGAFRSTDAGASWSFGVGGTSGLPVTDVALAEGGPVPALLATDGFDVWFSDAGAPFSRGKGEFPTYDVVAVGVDPNDAERITIALDIGVNDGQLRTSTDGGDTWTVEPAALDRWEEVAYAEDGTLYAVFDGPVSGATQEGLWRKDGSAWTYLGPDETLSTDHQFRSMALRADDPNWILLGGNEFILSNFEAVVFRSLDGGATWTKVFAGTTPNQSVSELVVSPDGQTIVGALTGSTGGVVRSTDGGATWAVSNTGLPAGSVDAIAAATEDPDTLFVTYNQFFGATGVAKSTDAGATWAPTAYGGNLVELFSDPTHPGVLYAGDVFDQILISTDGADSFALLPGDQSGFGPLRDVSFFAGACNTLHAATGAGLWRADVTCTLEAGAAAVSVGAGGSQALELFAGPEYAGRDYLIAGSATGTAGIPLGGVVIPLTLDAYTLFALNNPGVAPILGGLGVLDAEGRASASFTLPAGSDPAWAGLELHHAYLVFSLSAGFEALHASNAESVELVP